MDFITPTSLKVLAFFLADPMGEFHEREVLRNVGISKGSANRILRRFAELALLKRNKKGRMVFYRLNADDPFVKQMKVLSNVWELRPFIQELREGVKKVVLFGSCAEGTDVAESDIDLLLVTDEKPFMKERISAFNRQNRGPIAPIIVDLSEFMKIRKEDKPLFERIDRGIALWERI